MSPCGTRRAVVRRRVGALALTAALACLAPSIVAAQDPLSRALALFAEGEFERAREVLDDLPTDAVTDRARAVALRARLDAALGDTPSMERDVLVLAALDPEGRTLGPEVVPEVREAADRARGVVRGLQVRVDARRDGRRVRIDGRARDPRGVGGGVRVWARSVGGEWSSGLDALSFEASTSEPVEYYGELLGPGDVALVTDGTRADPRVLETAVREGVSPAEVADATPAAPSSGDETPWAWIGVGIGGGVALVAGAVVLGLVLTSSPTDTVLGAPMYPFGSTMGGLRGP